MVQILPSQKIIENTTILDLLQVRKEKAALAKKIRHWEAKFQQWVM